MRPALPCPALPSLELRARTRTHGYALYPSAQVAQNDALKTGLWGAYGRQNSVDMPPVRADEALRGRYDQILSAVAPQGDHGHGSRKGQTG